MSKDSKRFTEAKKAVDPLRIYSPLEAIRLLKGLKTANFDETVEVHIKLGVNPRHADQQVRGTLMLPHGTGKTVRVAVFAKGDKATEAQEAGADIVGAEDLAALIEGGMLDFDAAIATPDMMGVVGKLGRVLGPRGLMPNPKAGTVTFDVGKAVKDMKAGKVEYRTDKFGVIHLGVGKKSFEEQRLGRELRRADRGDRAGQAGGGQGQVPAQHHAHEHHGPGRARSTRPASAGSWTRTRSPRSVARNRRRPISGDRRCWWRAWAWYTPLVWSWLQNDAASCRPARPRRPRLILKPVLGARDSWCRPRGGRSGPLPGCPPAEAVRTASARYGAKARRPPLSRGGRFFLGGGEEHGKT